MKESFKIEVIGKNDLASVPKNQIFCIKCPGINHKVVTQITVVGQSVYYLCKEHHQELAVTIRKTLTEGGVD